MKKQKKSGHVWYHSMKKKGDVYSRMKNYINKWKHM